MLRRTSTTEAARQFRIDLLFVVLSFLAGAALLLLQIDTRPEVFTTSRLQWAGLVSLALIALRSIAVLRASYVFKEEEKERQLLNTVGLSLLKEVADATGVDYFRLGVHVFVYDAGLLANRALWFRKVRTFRRIVELRWPAEGRRAGLKLRPGVGAVGQAFATRSFQPYHIGELYRSYEHDEAGWNAQSEDFRAGMTFGQLKACRGYGLVVATPIFDADGEPAGCVAVDGPISTDELDAESLMHDAIDVIKQRMEDAAISVRTFRYIKK